MGIMLKQYLDRFAAIEKKANETLSETPDALVGVDSLPGSEHDQSVPAEAKKPDEEVQQGQPAGATSTEGAVSGGDAKPLNEGKLEVDEALTNAEQKPLITDDALTAKEANAHLVSLVGDLLADLKAPAKTAPAKTASAKTEDKGGEKKASKQEKQEIKLDEETISKIAAAQALFMAGREAAGRVAKSASNGNASVAENARKLIKDACVKAAQDAGLDPAAAESAAANAMAAAGVAPEAPAPEAPAPDAPEGDAGDAGAVPEIPEDVTEEELASAIIDCVNSGELDPETAKALVDEIAGEEAGAAPTEDQAAEIIAQGLESGEITPEQAQEIAAAIEGGEAPDAAGEGEVAADAEDLGAADAAEAAQDAADEAQGEADAEEAMKTAAYIVRQGAMSKVASQIVSNRNKSAAGSATPGSKIMSKVASILDAKVKAKKGCEANQQSEEAKYMRGFNKKAEEMGIDPKLLAKYIIDRHSETASK